MKNRTCFLLVIVGSLLFVNSFAQTGDFEQQQFERMIHEYGEISYTAWLTVMRGISSGLSPEVNKLYDVTQSPLDLALQFNDSQKEQIKKQTVEYLQRQDRGRQELLFQRAAFWVLAWQQWNICTSLKSIEETVAASYNLYPGQPVFEQVINNRRFDKHKVTGLDIASTMTPAEISGLEYSLLNEWSAMSREEILKTFGVLLTTIGN